MSMQLRRNVVFSVGFAVFAIAMSLVPAVNLVFSLSLLVLGLTIPVMVYALWHGRPVTVGLVPQTTNTDRRLATGNR